MKRAGTKYRVTALAAAVFGLLCLPCFLAPLLISAGLSSILLLVGTLFTLVLIGLIGLAAIGFEWWIRRQAATCADCTDPENLTKKKGALT